MIGQKSNVQTQLGCIVFILSAFVVFLISADGKFSLDWFMEFRGPRVLLGFGVGAALALAGVQLQSLFHNPLCEPYVLGVSSGAALGAIILQWCLGESIRTMGLALGGMVG